DWIGYNGICYFLSRDESTWDQAQALCFEVGASLDEKVMSEGLQGVCGVAEGSLEVSWAGLGAHRARGQPCPGAWQGRSPRVQQQPWGSCPGQWECASLAENKLRSVSCSNSLPYVCSRAQTPL
ncbi:CD69 protein, partial [Malurus elegans]|nr:CD69 protein [Malurus elegans]